MNKRLLIGLVVILALASIGCSKKDARDSEIAELNARLQAAEAALEAARSGNATAEQIQELEAVITDIAAKAQTAAAPAAGQSAQTAAPAAQSTQAATVTPVVLSTTPFTGASAMQTSLAAQPKNTLANPYKVSMNVSSLTGIPAAIRNSGRYISLDLSGSNLTSIGSQAFVVSTGKTNEYYSNPFLTSVILPNSVTRIEDSAFFRCENLSSVTIPNSVTSIGAGAFGDTAITSATIPNSVTSIGASAFGGTRLTAINVDSGNTVYSSQDGVLYNKAKTALIQYPAGKTGDSFTIPDSVTSIGDRAFNGCTRLTSVTIGSGVTGIGTFAFNSCPLTSVTIQGAYPNFSTFGVIPDSPIAGLMNASYNGGPGTYTRPDTSSSVWTNQTPQPPPTPAETPSRSERQRQ